MFKTVTIIDREYTPAGRRSRVGKPRRLATGARSLIRTDDEGSTFYVVTGRTVGKVFAEEGASVSTSFDDLEAACTYARELLLAMAPVQLVRS